MMTKPILSVVLLLAGSAAFAASQPREVSVRQILRGDCVGERVRTRGTVAEVFQDSIDTAYVHLFLADGDGMVEVAFSSKDFGPANFNRFVGANVCVRGTCQSRMGGWRRLSAPCLSGESDIEVLTPAPQDPFQIEMIESSDALSASHVLQQGRHGVEGVVRAAWLGNRLLVETRSGLKARVNLAHQQPQPKCGDCIRAVGFVDTDTANLFLTSAIWRPSEIAPPTDEAPTVLTEVSFRNDKLCSTLDTRPVSVDAVVRNLAGPVDAPNRLLVTVGNVPLQIDLGDNPDAFQGISAGSTIRATGVFLVETETWTRRTPFPRVTGYTIVLRSPDDLRVLQSPPWWTVKRLAALLGVFMALLLGIIGWNVSLNRRAHRRGKALAEEQLARVTADLKVSERTRLAVELHDALSQTLTGVSMQIDTAVGVAREQLPSVGKCLALASRTIDACRTELRNTLWDLRSEALDEPDMNTAIRRTLCQNLSGIDLSVRFNVPRERLSDNTAHALLKIVRELAANGIRHGKATSIKIAGAIEGDRLLVSVRDNGIGFDPDLAPGISEGHFGLQGIFERLERLNGEMTIDSAPGKGTKVTITLPLPTSG